MELVFPLLMVGVMVLSVFVIKAQADARRQSWMDIAHRLKLDFHAGGAFSYPSMSGRYRGVDLKIDVELRGGKNKVPYTRLHASVMPQVPSDVALYPQGFLQGVARLFGMQDIEVDDPDFDDHVVVQAEDVRSVRALLSSSRLRRTLVSVFRDYTQARVDDGEVWIVRRGFTDDLRFLTTDLDRLVELHTALTQAGAHEAGLDEELEPAVAQALAEEREAVAHRRALLKAARERVKEEEKAKAERRAAESSLGAPPQIAPTLPPAPAVAPPPAPVVAPPAVAPPPLLQERAPEVTPLERLVSHTPGPSALEPAPPALTQDPAVAPLERLVSHTPGPSALEPDEAPTSLSPSALQQIDPEDLARLAQRGLGGRDLDAAVEAVTGCALSVADQPIREVRRSSAFDGSAAYRGGQMAVVRVEGWPELSLRFQKDDPRGAALKRGGSITATGEVVAWERLYRRLVVEVR